MTEISDKAVEAAITAFNEACSSPVMVSCKRCAGKGYHHGFGEDGASPDWCSDCDGGGYELADGEDRRPFRAALSAALPHLGAAGVAVPETLVKQVIDLICNDVLPAYGVSSEVSRNDPELTDAVRSALVPSPVPQEGDPVAQALLSALAKSEAECQQLREEISIRAAPSALVAEPAAEPCTCHPDDNPPRPCPQKYALSECKKAAAALVAEPGEPVAWQWRYKGNPDWEPWNRPHLPDWAKLDRYETRPLFAAPPARQDGALREALEKTVRLAITPEIREGLAHFLVTGVSDVGRRAAIDALNADPETSELLSGAAEMIAHDAAKAVAAALAQSAAPVQQAAPSGEGE